MKESSLRNVQRRQMKLTRDVMVVQHIVILGIPSAILWVEGLITGHLHPLIYRIQAIIQPQQ